MSKIILDLCGGTGAWSKPYEKDYIVVNVTLPFYDVLKTEIRDEVIIFQGGNKGSLAVWINDIYGILASPVCTMFSLARTRAKTPRDLRLGMKLVTASLNIIWECRYDHIEEEISNRARNKRCVWTIPTQPFPEAHFAVYPEGLIDIPIKAGCPEYMCKKCGKPRVKIYKTNLKNNVLNPRVNEKYSGGSKFMSNKTTLRSETETNCIGYSDCGCNAGFEPGIVLDPFMGAGTTALVALKQRKRFIGIEIKKEYIDMAKRRIANVQQNIF